MIYQDLINSTAKPTYENMTGKKIITEGDKKTVVATITWNKKNYEFRWGTKLSDDEIDNQLNSKIETMLTLAIRYNLGEKTTGIKYNLKDQTIERRKGEAKPKISVLNFDSEAKHVADKISSLGKSPEKAKLEKLQYRQNRIAWTQKMFATLGVSTVPVPKNSTPKPTIEVHRITDEGKTTTTTTTTPKTTAAATASTTTTTTPTAAPKGESTRPIDERKELPKPATVLSTATPAKTETAAPTATPAKTETAAPTTTPAKIETAAPTATPAKSSTDEMELVVVTPKKEPLAKAAVSQKEPVTASTTAKATHENWERGYTYDCDPMIATKPLWSPIKENPKPSQAVANQTAAKKGKKKKSTAKQIQSKPVETSKPAATAKPVKAPELVEAQKPVEAPKPNRFTSTLNAIKSFGSDLFSGMLSLE